MELNENIYNLRKKKKISQEDLAEKVEVTRQTISNWELGSTSPNPKQLILLSKALNVSVDELIGNDVKHQLIDDELDNEEKNRIEENTSNTERLAGLIIKILKAIGILFIIFVVIVIIMIVMFIAVREEQNPSSSSSIEISCSLDNNKYTIGISDDNYFNCDNCNDEMIDILGTLTNTESMEDSVQNIEDYFLKNGGTCE